jgi:tetratricopeptide (TPR) repeat protein
MATIDTALAHAERLLARDPELAAQQAQEILRIDPNHPEARRLLAAAQLARGQVETALEILEPLVQAHPDWARAQFDLGMALGRDGRSEMALSALHRAVALDRNLPQAWLALGDHLSAIGDVDGAQAAYLAHVRCSAGDPELMRAAAALAEERIPEAETVLRAVLRRRPTDVAAIRMLAELGARLGRLDDARRLLERCLEVAPAFDAARQNLAQVLHRGNRPLEALAEVETLLSKSPDNPGYRNLKAVILCRIGDYAPAIDLYEDILARYPNQSRIWLSLGHALKTAGHQTRAIAAYRRCIALEPDFGEAWWSLANLKTLRFDAADLDAMRSQLARGDLSQDNRLHLDFALGKALEDAGDYADSFVHYREGNALRRRQLPYDAGDTSERLQAIRRVYTREFFAARAGSGSDARDPIFIVGMPRAGSTLLEQILSSHPQVEGTMELPELLSTAGRLRRQGSDGAAPYHEVLAALDAAGLRALGEEYLERTRVHRKSDAPLFIDKMPNNFAHIGLIHLALPNARIIDARRHPLACGFSVFKQHFARGQGFSYDLADIGRYYRDYVAVMAHFDVVLPGRIHRVFYEDMVGDTETEVRRLLAYCGLDFDPACLRFFENRRAVRTASSEQVRQPIHRQGLEQWRHYAPWLGPLEQALGPVLTAYPVVPDALDTTQHPIDETGVAAW